MEAAKQTDEDQFQSLGADVKDKHFNKIFSNSISLSLKTDFWFYNKQAAVCEENEEGEAYRVVSMVSFFISVSPVLHLISENVHSCVCFLLFICPFVLWKQCG